MIVSVIGIVVISIYFSISISVIFVGLSRRHADADASWHGDTDRGERGAERPERESMHTALFSTSCHVHIFCAAPLHRT